MSMIQIDSVRRVPLLLMGIFCLIMGYSQQAAGSKADKHMLTAGEFLLTQGKYLESIGLLHEIAKHSKNDDIKSAALFLIAKAEHTYLDNPEVALKRFINITNQFPNTPAASKALFQSGIILFDKQQYQKAIFAFNTYVQRYPTGNHKKAAEVWIQIATPLCSNSKKKNPVVNTKHRRPKSIPSPPRVRVLVQRQMDTIVFKSQDLITVTNCKNQQKIYSGWGPVQFTTGHNRLRLNGQTLSHSTYKVSSASSILRIKDLPYRGSFVITTALGESLHAINHVKIEDYLYGVVPREMPDSWAEQALMAQAVAARTYALYIKEKSDHPFYDLEATTASQVYGGCNSESKRSTKAVNATRGQVMTHDGRLIIAYFHSNSGGHTESPANVWNTGDIPYLDGIPDQFSKKQPEKTWEYFLSYTNAVKRLNQSGLEISRLDRINVTHRSKSGRYSKVRIYSNKGVAELSSNHFRALIGEARVKSTLFHVYSTPGGILFKGKGYGHGVGMSQWGARRMAQSGSTYQDILKFYYKGIKIKNLKS